MERVAGLEALMGLRWVMEVGPSESTPELPGESGQPALLSTQLPTPPLREKQQEKTWNDSQRLRL